MKDQHTMSAKTWTKHRGLRDSSLLLEAASLSWLAEAEAQGGIRVAHVIKASDEVLVEERIEAGSPSRAAARRIGRALAHTHAAGAPFWGCSPAGWKEQDLWVGRARTPMVGQAAAPGSWGEFFAEYRMRYYIRLLRNSGTFSRAQAELLERVADRVEAGIYTSEQPALVCAAMTQNPEIGCARLHGDLWGGNVIYDANTNASTGGVLIDPMAHGGHAETDLAMLALFGFAYLEDVLAAYNEVSPLASGWRERVGLHQLTPLLLHCVLFGGGYVAETCSVARRYA